MPLTRRALGASARRWTVLALLLATPSCRPSTVAEAEAKRDIPWLDGDGTTDAIAALGRLADTDPKAVEALEARSSFDGEAFVAAWAAVVRGAPWGTDAIRQGLGDPKRADRAATAMSGADPRVLAFLPDLEAALVRLSASEKNLNLSTLIASIGAPAHDLVVRRLVDASTRGAMCRGIASGRAAADARRALIDVPVSARDAPSCVNAVVHVAADDDAALAWMALRAEPGLLGAAGNGAELSCARLHVAWSKALAARPAEVYSALTVPLGYAVKRCPAEMDGVLADAIAHLPLTREVVVQAIDPFGAYEGALRATCAALPSVADGRDPPIVRERASDAINHACKAL
jgi:hypothetical protein